MLEFFYTDKFDEDIKNNFNCDFCHFLTSLEGAPEKVGRDFVCSQCNLLESLAGGPKEVGRCFGCSY